MTTAANADDGCSTSAFASAARSRRSSSRTHLCNWFTFTQAFSARTTRWLALFFLNFNRAWRQKPAVAYPAIPDFCFVFGAECDFRAHDV
ncbi:hypothetical protein Bxe_A1777 [Paraburkholderia xenovorans LB400]|uniref:Uncharacterized protein n=1 Tax=Paraburkholderia xenovorans (strain LB400) TaxID=266265 RepID=Q13XK9_PARXL|nr:hypothetical protein Bxe_A1777 [Paraburkholderia xenovorans LB400]